VVLVADPGAFPPATATVAIGTGFTLVPMMRIAAAGLVVLAGLLGSGIARADSSLEKEACRLMDDPAGAQSGYAPAEYAFMMLRAKMSAEAARNAMSLGVHDFCPNHITDLPAGWR
jgi:hypothetical protein